MRSGPTPSRLPTATVGILVGLVSAGVIAALAATDEAAAPAEAEREIRAYVVADADVTEWLVRIPLELTEQWGLPRRVPGYVDLGELDGSARQRFAASADDMVGLVADGDPVAPDEAVFRISPPHSRHFDALDSARAHLAETQDPDAPVYWNQGFADVRFLSPPQERPFSVKLAVPPSARPHTSVTVTFVGADGERAVYDVSATREVVPLTPSRGETLGRFLWSGATAPVVAWGVLALVIAVLLPAGGRPATVVRLIGVVLAGLAIGAAAWRYTDLAADSLVQASLPPAVGAGLVWTAVRGLLTRRPDRPGLSTLVWSAVVGVVAAQQMEPLVQFSPGLGLLDTLGYVVGAGATVSLAAAVVVGAVRLMQREPRSARYGPVILLLLMVHLGWHQLLQRGDDAALLAVLEVRMIEASEAVDLLSASIYGATTLAVGWAAWELRALWRARRTVAADEPPASRGEDDVGLPQPPYPTQRPRPAAPDRHDGLRADGQAEETAAGESRAAAGSRVEALDETKGAG